MKIQHIVTATLFSVLVSASGCAAEIGTEADYYGTGGVGSCPNCVGGDGYSGGGDQYGGGGGATGGVGSCPNCVGGGGSLGGGVGGSGDQSAPPGSQAQLCLLVCGNQANNCGTLAGWAEPSYAPDVTAITTCLAQGNCLNAYACRR